MPFGSIPYGIRSRHTASTKNPAPISRFAPSPHGQIGWLTGFWCQTHFLADALSCIDYLETRPDTDLSRGVAMTGVSGGGLTTMFCAAIDERIAFSAPVCCITDHETLHLTDLYSSCTE